MTPAKKNYYELQSYIEKWHEGFQDEITDYVDELESQNKEMLDSVINIARVTTKGGWVWTLVKPIIEKHTGKTIEEVIK